MFSVHGSGRSSRANISRPEFPKRSETAQGYPKLMRLAWMRFFNMTR
jgi:hypothetical protein